MDIGQQRKHELEMQGCWIYSEDQRFQSEEGISKESDGFSFVAEPTTGNVVKPMEMSFNANAMHWGRFGFTQLLALANQSSLGLNYVPGPEVEFPAAQQHCYDLDVFPGTTNNGTYEGVPDFAPVTPEKPARTEDKQQLSEMQHLHEEDRRDEKNDKQKNGGVLTTVNIIEINNDKELPMAASDSLLSDAAVSAPPPPKEKHLSGKEDDGYQIDLNKTPQQKTKRKKHRPKVVKEGKPKTPKPVTPKPATGSTGKRKYVRKNGLNKASKTPPAEVVGQCSESKTLEATRKSCRRVLNFAEEQPEDKHSTNRSPSLDSDSYSHIFCSSGVVSKSTVQLCNAIQVTGGNTQAGTASELGCSSHQMQRSYMSNPIIFDSPQTDIRSPNTSNCSTTINLGKGEEAKRKYCHAVKQAESSSSNLIGSYYNSIQAYQAYHMSYLDLPNIGHFPKRKRTEKTDPCDKNKVSVAGWKEIQNFPCVVALGQDARSTRKRSRVHTRVRVKKGDEQRAEYCCKPQTCIDALVTDIGATLIKRKRTKKINSLQPTGSPLEIVAIDAIIDQLKSLDINKEQNALVLYTKVDTIVPYEATKRRLRAKVALDEETTRVWKLLLDNINSEGVDGLDEEKIKWWEEERTVFRGRSDSFIARMHLVQGDRGFSRWKGSVVDSVVGVFLTQNVSDHLSSSAFMALAAHFPLESRNNDKAVVCINEIPNSPVKSWSSMTLFSGSNGPVSSTNEIDCEMVCSSETGQGIHYNQLVNVSDISGTVTECRTERNGKTSDEDSSQNYVDSSISQTGDKGCSCSDTNSEVEDLPNKSKHDSLDSSTLFVELLQKAESNELHEVFVHGEYKYNRTKGPEHDKQKQTMDNDGPRTSKGVSSMDNAGASPVECFEIFREETQSSTFSQNKDENSMSGQSTLTVENAATSKSKRKRVQKDKNQEINWDKLREQAEINGKREKTPSTMDSLDWDAVRCADVNEIAETIKERGMNHMLAERIKDFLNRLVREHGSIDLEWLRDVPPDKAKEYLLSIRGLGLKSVECVRLLTLHHLAFPVDTNVGRIAVRLGWVPLQPLPESLQLHLLELYPVLESIQKYLWPRLCKLDQRTLYELHYQMITFGKVFCTKNKPNCNACPMRGECRHFASAFASARLSLPWPEEKRVVSATGTVRDVNPTLVNNGTQFALLQATNHLDQNHVLDVNHQPVAITTSRNCEPIIEEPASPEPECTQIPEDIEDAFSEDPDGIPTIKLNVEQFTQNLHTHMQESLHLQEGDMSKALVAIATGATSIPVPMLKNVRRLRTEHLVYELPDSHALLNVLNMEKREPDDPCLYLLAIWTPGETADSIQLPQNRCNSEGCVALCNNNECLSCNTVREESSQTVRGTLLIPCRTAMRGSFPLNGTYFQVNEVFADHETSHKPVDVPRSWLWKLKRRTVYFGTSVPSIFKGLSTHEIQQCFWRGHVCVRGFDKRTRAPRPLATRLHCPASKVDKKNVNER